MPLQSQALSILEMNKVQQVKWCMKQTKLTSAISCPTDSCLAQLVEHQIRRLWVQPPLGAIFDEIYFVLCNFSSAR